ncbi:MAG: hypothetical protein P4L99_02645 [Chthoniobacter sp.]|nr:hypothetical protein [Chthoniobacter sp.]
MSRWKIVLSFVAVFVAGMVVGGALGVRAAHRFFFNPPSAREAAQHMLDQLQSDLGLSADQLQKIEPIVSHSAAEAESVHQQMHVRFDEIFRETDRQIEEQLTDEQKAKFEKFKARRPKPPDQK